MPQAGRINSGYALRAGENLYQLDCGGGVTHSFQRRRLDSLSVKKIFISHTHPDHVSDLPLFVQMNYLAGRTERLDIHLPSEAVDIMQKYFDALYQIQEKYPFEYRFIPVDDGNVIKTQDLRVRPILNGHFTHNRELIERLNLPNKLQCFSYLIESHDSRILYSADLGSEEDIFDWLDNLNLLIVESTHVDLERLFIQLQEKDTAKVLITHIAPDYDVDQARMTANKLGLQNVIFAEDGLSIEL